VEHLVHQEPQVVQVVQEVLVLRELQEQVVHPKYIKRHQIQHIH
jgi:hypothetical protein